MLSDRDVKELFDAVRTARESLHRAEALLARSQTTLGDLERRNPKNKQGRNLTERGAEVCYRLFDQGKSRYAVSQVLGISFGAATHRFHVWEKLGGPEREKQPLDGD